MTRPSRPTARRRALAVLTIGATVAGGGALLGPGTSSASSHREAPYTASDPAIDNTDLYAFTSPDKTSTATIIANWSPFEEPSGGPNFFPWATDAAYDVNIDNNGDAKPDLIYRWTFKDVDKRGTTNHGDKVGSSFIYNDGAVTSFNDPNLLFKQTYDLNVIKPANSSGNPTGTDVTTNLLTGAEAAPDNVGKTSMPNWAGLRAEAVTSGKIAGGAGGQSYAGQADDPFYLDLRVFDLLYGAPTLKEAGFDSLRSFNVKTIALQVPKTALAGGGTPGTNPVIGVWSTTSRNATRTLKTTNQAPTTDASHSSDAVDVQSGGLQQVSRLGNPLVNEVVVPANLKDYFNRSTPDKDGQFLGKVQDPELPYLVQATYGITNPNSTPGGKNRPDLVAAFLTGISKKAAAGTDFGGLAKGSPSLDLNSLDLNANNAAGGPAPAEYLRLNLNTAVTASPNRLGVLGGDTQGFPNGRRLTDDVLDIAVQAAEGVLVPDQAPAIKTAVSGLGDGVSRNDVPFLSTFPYIADAHSGSDPHIGIQPVRFRQSFVTGGTGVIRATAAGISPAQPGSYAVLYRVREHNALQSLGSYPLNAAGTAVNSTVTLNFPAGSNVVLYWKVFAAPGNSFGTNGGIPTSLTVR